MHPGETVKVAGTSLSFGDMAGEQLDTARFAFERMVRALSGVEMVIEFDNVVSEPENSLVRALYVPTS